MLALREDVKARFLKSSHGSEVIDSGNLRHDLHRNPNLTNNLPLHQLVHGCEIFSNDGAYAHGTNMFILADCGRQIQLEFFFGNQRDRRQSLAKAELLSEIVNAFCKALREEAILIEQKAAAA